MVKKITVVFLHRSIFVDTFILWQSSRHSYHSDRILYERTKYIENDRQFVQNKMIEIILSNFFRFYLTINW